MSGKALVACVLGSALAALAPSAVASDIFTKPAGVTGQALSEESLVQRYSALAGSPANAKAMVAGLRSGTPFTLVAAGGTPTPRPPAPACPNPPCMLVPGPAPAPTGTIRTTITPPEGKGMGWGNVDYTLAIAEAKLGTGPKHAELKTVLDTILAARASGSGWKAIAKTLGLEVVE